MALLPISGHALACIEAVVTVRSMSYLTSLFIALTASVSAHPGLFDGVPLSSRTSSECIATAFPARSVVTDLVVPSIAIADPQLLALASVTQFDAPCASQIRTAKLGLIQLNDGTVLEASSGPEFGYRISDSLGFSDSYDTRNEAERKLPLIGSYPLLASARVNAKTKGGDFIGVWKIDGRWAVQAFSQKSDGTFTKPESVFTSSLPIRSVEYFPAPDSPSGSLFVVQEQPDGQARAIQFFWSHRHTFV